MVISGGQHFGLPWLLPWLLKLLGNKLLLLRLRLLRLWLLLSHPSPGCEDQLELLLSNVDLLRGALTLLPKFQWTYSPDQVGSSTAGKRKLAIQ